MGVYVCMCVCARRQNDGCVCLYGFPKPGAEIGLDTFPKLGGSSGRPETAILDLVSSNF